MADNHIKFPLNNENNEAPADIFPDLHNEALLEAMKAVNKEENRETQAALIEQALKAKFFAPVDIIGADGKPLEGYGKMSIPKDAKFNFKLIKNAQDEQYFALFTDIDEFKKWSGDAQIRTMVVVFPQMASLAMSRSDVINGFVINPLGDNVIFKQEALQAILEIIKKNAEKMQQERKSEGRVMTAPLFAKAENIPDSVTDSLKKNLKKHSEVECGYFCLMKENEKEYYLFTLDIKADAETSKKIADSFANTARLFLTKYPVIVLPQASPYGSAAKSMCDPFYNKE